MSADQRHRRAALMAHERLLEACAAARAEVYVIHPDYSETPIAQRAETRAALQESFAVLDEAQPSYPVRIAVENMPGRQHSHFAGPELDLAGLDLALDLGHAQISGTLEAFLRTAEIAHLHLHDNLGFGGSDLHLPLGRGRLTPGLVQRLLEGCDGLCVLEHDSEVQFRQSLGFLSRLQLRRDVA